MTWNLWHRQRCSRCGRFISYAADSGIRYGSYGDLEPPDPQDFCQHCADELMDTAKTTPEKATSGGWWMKPTYVHEAEKLMRHKQGQRLEDEE